LPRYKPLFEPTFRGERTVRYADVTEASEYGKLAPHHGMPEGHVPIRSYLAVPVLSGGGSTLGGLFFGHREAGMFTERHEELAEGVARWASIALANARLIEAERKAKSMAEAAVRARDEVRAIVSHDLRSPLQTVLAACALVEETQLDEVQRGKQASVIRRAAEQMTRLTQDLLDLGKIQAGRMTIQAEAVEVSALLEEARSMFEASGREKGLEIHCERVGQLPLIDADRSRMLQALSNLVGNALRHTERGSIILRAQQDADRVQFSVVDTGSGIHREHLPKLFDQFYQARDGHGAGAGLGLSITRGIIEAHGGRIWVESEVGKGSRFHFSVPAMRATPTQVGSTQRSG
jgi:signal transduction histidine kinase